MEGFMTDKEARTATPKGLFHIAASLWPVMILVGVTTAVIVAPGLLCAFWPKGSGEFAPTILFYAGVITGVALAYIFRLNPVDEKPTSVSRARRRIMLYAVVLTLALLALCLAYDRFLPFLWLDFANRALSVAEGISASLALLAVANALGGVQRRVVIVALPLAIVVCSALLEVLLFTWKRAFFFCCAIALLPAIVGLATSRQGLQAGAGSDRVSATTNTNPDGHTEVCFFALCSLCLASIGLCTYARDVYQGLSPLAFEDVSYVAGIAGGIGLGALVVSAFVVAYIRRPGFLPTLQTLAAACSMLGAIALVLHPEATSVWVGSVEVMMLVASVWDGVLRGFTCGGPKETTRASRRNLLGYSFLNQGVVALLLFTEGSGIGWVVSVAACVTGVMLAFGAWKQSAS